ncbi:choice-of-anchor J domain-containing protein [uncultured Psychroserpens sp.]|uniref:T9SS-dependent choice-of-anchor J family protein n=1 Tax=uncultured Psychroserpens sp. TaxID=255436 RepID=UPI0026130DA7|nr:choice-of-anchor J domain-containing protein [uncultured Psychroserpens sp.]
MKHIITYILLLFMITIIEAQTVIVSEDFETGSFPPNGWVTYRGLDDIGPNNDWEVTASANTGNNAAFSRYSDPGIGIAEDWLVSPLIDLSNTTNAALSFFSREFWTTSYASQYDIRVSTASQTAHADFTTLATYNDFPLDYEKFTIDLSTYDGQQIYIAFVHVDEYQDDWYLDDIEVSGIIMCNIENTATPNVNLGMTPTTNLYAQEFVANCSGNLEEFAFFAYINPNINQVLPAGTFNIYQGNPQTGTIIYSQGFDAIVPVGNGELLFDLDNNIQLTANQNYTIEIPVTSLNISILYQDPYPEGVPYINGTSNTNNWDFFFKINIAEETLDVNTYKTNSIELFPNPTSDYISISNLNTKENYAIYDVTGKTLASGQLLPESQISVIHLEKGIYFLKLNNRNTLKFIKN